MSPDDSRALDREVAIDVMGLGPDRGMGPGAVLPRFGTDVGAAWQVVDQMGRRFPGMKLKLLQDDLGWSAMFSEHKLATTPMEASGRSPAEAICARERGSEVLEVVGYSRWASPQLL